jgi:hypothetical protein
MVLHIKRVTSIYQAHIAIEDHFQAHQQITRTISNHVEYKRPASYKKLLKKDSIPS